MATFTLPPRPAPLPIFRTCIYKTVGKTSIQLDIYLPTTGHNTIHPVMLFIHGGGWTGSNLVSMDYRLVPESSFTQQQADVQDVEHWLRNRLSFQLEDTGAKVDSERIVVVGASAGAHLALLTPKLWERLPVAILSMYGPTNMHHLPYLGLGRLSALTLPPCTPDLLGAATNFSRPPAEIKIPKSAQDYVLPRGIMSLHIFRNSLLVELLLRGLPRGDDGRLTLPRKGSVETREIDEISPLILSTRIQYPPIYQVMGTADEIFQIFHLTNFHDSLESRGVKCEKMIVPGRGHAFDMWAEIGSQIHEDIIGPAVDWVVEVARGEKGV